MCEAHAYLLRNDKEVKFLDSVDKVDIDGDEITIVNIFGEQKILKARIKSYSNTESKILFEEIN